MVKFKYSETMEIPPHFSLSDAVTINHTFQSRRVEIYYFTYIDDKSGTTKEIAVFEDNAHQRNTLMSYLQVLIAHLGVFSFLMQVFNDSGLIAQMVVYTHLVLLVIVLALFCFTIIDDMVSFRNIHRTNFKKETLLIWTSQCPDLARYYSLLERKTSVFYAILSHILSFCLTVVLIFLEIITMVYVVKNTLFQTVVARK